MEACEFLQWLHDDHYTFMGYRELDYEGRGKKARLAIHPDSGMGILRDSERQVFEGLRNLADMPVEVQEALLQPDLIRITKGNNRSTVHRRVHLDTVAVRKFDAKGKPIGEYLFIGLLTSVAYNQSPREIPLLRSKVAEVFTLSGFEPASHSGKALMHILESYPRDELFQSTEDRASGPDTAMGVLLSSGTPAHFALFLRRGSRSNALFPALVYVPRDRFYDSTPAPVACRPSSKRQPQRQRSPRSTRFLTDEVPTRVCISSSKPHAGEIPEIDHDSVDRTNVWPKPARSWVDKSAPGSPDRRMPGRGTRHHPVCAAFSKAFPASLPAITVQRTQSAAFDVNADRRGASTDGGLSCEPLSRPLEAEAHRLHFKLYIARASRSRCPDVLPMLENMGLKVMERKSLPASRSSPRTDPKIRSGFTTSMISVSTQDGDEIDRSPPRCKRGVSMRAFVQVFGAARWKTTASTGWCSRRGSTAREITVLLRCYCKYLASSAQIPVQPGLYGRDPGRAIPRSRICWSS